MHLIHQVSPKHYRVQFPSRRQGVDLEDEPIEQPVRMNQHPPEFRCIAIHGRCDVIP